MNTLAYAIKTLEEFKKRIQNEFEAQDALGNCTPQDARDASMVQLGVGQCVELLEKIARLSA